MLLCTRKRGGGHIEKRTRAHLRKARPKSKKTSPRRKKKAGVAAAAARCPWTSRYRYQLPHRQQQQQQQVLDLSAVVGSWFGIRLPPRKQLRFFVLRFAYACNSYGNVNQNSSSWSRRNEMIKVVFFCLFFFADFCTMLKKFSTEYTSASHCSNGQSPSCIRIDRFERR